MANIWDAAKQYFRDAMPGGALNPEVSRQGILDTAAISLTPVPIVGDIAGLLADANRYATDPSSRTPGNFALSGLGLLPFVPGVTMWHGGPHKLPPEPGFPAGRLRLDKIGTGEGAQAYGHGIYGAVAPEVARTYLGVGNTKGGSRAEARLAREMEKATDAGRYGEALALEELLINRSPAKAISRFSEASGGQQYKDALAAVKKYSKHFEEGGNLYKFDLPDSVLPRLLDWDAPLSQQPKEAVEFVRQRLKEQKYLGPKDNGPRQLEAALRSWKMEHGGMGESKMESLVGGRGNLLGATPEEVAQNMRQIGLPGLRYLDGNSRGAGQGSRNYVIWDQGLLDQMPPLEINGVPTGLLK